MSGADPVGFSPVAPRLTGLSEFEMNRRRRQMTAEEQALFGIEKLNVSRSEIPAVTHVDYSARVQTVHAETNPLFHALLSAFRRKTGCPVFVNTSFNVRGEPIVRTPEDAFRCFMGTELDALAIGNLYLSKREQNPHSSSTTRTYLISTDENGSGLRRR